MFWIQVSNPIILETYDCHCTDLSDAIQSMFPMETETAFIVWDCLSVPLSYKYDLSIIIDDLLPFLDRLINDDSGSDLIMFSSSSFMVDWQINWSDNSVNIESSWKEIAGGCRGLLTCLNERNTLNIDLNLFLSEWKRLLQILMIAIEQSGVVIQDTSAVQQLKNIESQIPSLGRLYSTEAIA